MTASGPVPRELMAGIVWDADAEERFQERAGILQHDGKMSQEDAEREARWSVESELHRFFIWARVEDAQRCYIPEDKRDLVERWREAYGEDRTNRLVAILRDPKQVQVILKGAEWRKALGR